MLDEIDNKHLRPLRKQCFLDMAKCCDIKDRQAFQNCLQRTCSPGTSESPPSV